MEYYLKLTEPETKYKSKCYTVSWIGKVSKINELTRYENYYIDTPYYYYDYSKTRERKALGKLRENSKSFEEAKNCLDEFKENMKKINHLLNLKIIEF